MLSDAPDIAQLDLALSQTANSLTQHCPGQYTAEPSAVPECSAGLSAVPDSAAVLDSAQLDSTVLSWTFFWKIWPFYILFLLFHDK